MLWVVALGLTAEQSIRGALPWVSPSIADAASPAEAPILEGALADVAGGALGPGDRLLVAGDRSLAGRSGGYATLALLAAADDARRARVQVLEAGGILPRARVVVLDEWPVPWQTLALSAAFALAAMLIRLRGREVAAARSGFAAGMALALTESAFWGGSFPRTGLAVGVVVVSHALWGPLALRALVSIGRAPGTSLPSFARWWPWLFVVRGLAAASVGFEWPFSAEVGRRLAQGLDPLLIAALVFACGGALRRGRARGVADRRIARWALYGLLIVASPAAVTAGVGALVSALVWDPLAPEFWWLAWLEGVAATLALALPVAGVVAAARARAADVDRWLSATLSYGVLGALLLVGLIAVVPGTARAAADGLGVDPRSAELLVALGIALALVPFDQRLRSLFDAWLFPERRALRHGVDQLLDGVETASSLDAAFARAGHGLETLLSPEWLRVDAASGPPSEEAEPAVSPVYVSDADASTDGREGGLRIPMRSGERVVGLLALGPKRSGDVYSTTDRALLGSVAERLASRWRADADAVEIERGRSRAEALRAAAEQADRENLAKSRFLAAASHDLRQPLHALGLFVETLDARVADPELRGLVERIRQSTHSLEDMMSALLDLSKLDAGGVEPDVTDVALGPLLDRVCTDLAPLARAKALTLRCRPNELWVRSDPVLLTRIVQNLVTNALRYTDEGGVLVAARRRGDRVRLEVRDTGRGIPPEQLEHIFGEFRQLERDAASGGPGLGLGLSIVERLCRLLEHRIDVRSTPDRGSLFAISLPRTSPVARAAPAVPTVGLADPALAQRRVWVVDDDPLIRDALCRTLELWGCRPRAFAGLAETLAGLGEEPDGPDLLISDDHLERETGPEVIAALHDAAGRAMPVVIVTGDATPERLRELRATGHPVLQKPVPAARLRAAAAQLLRGSAP